MAKGKDNMLTVKQAAERLDAAEVSVRMWVKAGRFPGAKKESTVFGDFWMIPESAVASFEKGKAGRPPRPDSELKYPRRKSRAKGN
jgi:hypothetical protein